MSSTLSPEVAWGSSYRLVASEKWKAKSAVMGRPVTEKLVEYARPTLGMHVLDLASGTGEPAITLASKVGPNGHITALDLSADLLEITKSRARDRGISNLTTLQADANELPFPDHSFDLITCRFGVMFFREQALRETYRVLKPMARACFCAWGPFTQPYWESTMGVVVKHVGGPAIGPQSPDPFKFAEPGGLSAELRRAGFPDTEEETVTLPWTWPGTPQEVWEQARAVGAPFRPLLERVPQKKWPEIDREVYEAIGRYVEGDIINFGAQVVLAAATKA